jgi:predicted glycosyltransferase
MGKKHIRFKAYIEQFYLHSNYFKPKKILKDDEYALIRYISYDAGHDYKVKNIASEEKKIELVSELSKRIKVYVSSESEITSDSYYNDFKLNIHPSEMHSVIANATVFISEGATMASEAGVLGTPYYYINPLAVGYINHQEENYKNAHSCHINEVLKNIDSLLEEKDEKIVAEIENSTINPTKFLIHFIQNYPKSVKNINNRIVEKTSFKT